MRLLLNTWRPSTGSCFCMASAPLGGQLCYCTENFSSAPPCGHTCYCTTKRTNFNSSFNLFLNHSCKSSIHKIKCSFHSHFIYKVIFREGREDGHRFSPVTSITLTVRAACCAACYCCVTWGGGAKQNHTMVLTVGDLGHSSTSHNRTAGVPPLGPGGAFGPRVNKASKDSDEAKAL